MKKSTIFIMLFAFLFGFSQPTTNAPTPTQAASDVISIFSDSYTNVATNYNPFWGQSGGVNPTFMAVSGSGNNILAYTNFNYQGTELSTQNAASMEFLHIDIWISNATVVKVSPINNGTGASEFLVTVPIVNAGWSSVNLPKSAFTGMTWDSVFQLKFDGQAGTTPSTIYLDNIYFWKNPVNPAADATLSDLKVNGTTVTGFNPAITTYTVQMPNGTTTVPQISAATTTNASATKVITQATSLPGSGNVMVTAQNGVATKTYTINFVVSGPSMPAPTPPNRPAGDVISLFSNSYTNIPVSEWSTSWDDSNITNIQVAGNDIKKIDFTNFLGVQLTNYTNASAMTHFHMDYFIDNGVDLVGKVINPKWSNHAAQAGETSAFLLNHQPSTTGSWVSIDVPISNFDTAPQVRNALYQFLISSNVGTVYVDNIYFHKNTTLGTQETKLDSKVSVYPNPVKSGEWVTLNAEVNQIELYNLLGQKVKNATKNSIDTNDLEKGVYILKANLKNGSSQNSKIIVK